MEGTVFSSLEICGPEDNQSYVLLTVKRQNGELHVLRTERSGELEKIKDSLVKRVPLLLILNTPNILTKQIGNGDASSPEAMVDHAFPNLDMGSFYYEIVQDTFRPIVSIAKKAYVDGIIAKMAQEGISFTNVNLGLSPISSVLTHLTMENIVISNFILSLEHGSISKISTNSQNIIENYDLEGIRLTSCSLLGFSGILGHIGHVRSISNFDGLREKLVNVYKNDRVFQTVTRGGVLFFLALLLINFLVFDHYTGKLEDLKTIMALSSGQRKHLKSVQESVQQKQQNIELLQASSNSRSTFYLDRFANNLPATILLSRIVYQPLKKPVRASKPIELEANSVLVSGVSANSVDYSNWIAEMEKEEWTAKVETMDYDYVSKESSNFSVKIELDEN